MIKRISEELSNRNIYHKIESDSIRTRKSKIKIPKVNKDIAYLLGVIDGDGSLSITERKRGGYHYLFRIYSGSKEYINYLKGLLGSLFLIDGRINRDKRKKNSYYLRIENAAFFFYFANLGSEIGKKKVGNLPKIVETNKNYASAYLAGLVDTDGSVYKKRIQFKQKRINLIKEVSKLCQRLNLNCSNPKINYTNNIPFYYIRFDNKLPLRWKTNKFKN
ncbi:MAG: hypothetical protein NTU63_02965 [Candidatus Pacearchaeota archaeon]|nr:hypothetical protein [Candidatus Pacearchaeota archaeon]